MDENYSTNTDFGSFLPFHFPNSIYNGGTLPPSPQLLRSLGKNAVPLLDSGSRCVPLSHSSSSPDGISPFRGAAFGPVQGVAGPRLPAGSTYPAATLSLVPSVVAVLRDRAQAAVSPVALLERPGSAGRSGRLVVLAGCRGTSGAGVAAILPLLSQGDFRGRPRPRQCPVAPPRSRPRGGLHPPSSSSSSSPSPTVRRRFRGFRSTSHPVGVVTG